MGLTIATPQFLYSAREAKKNEDSRPCFNKEGDRVVFMRTTESNPASALFTVPATCSPGNKPRQLFPGVTPTSDNEATRPDWSWVHGRIAFAGALKTNLGLFIINGDGSDCRHVPILVGENQHRIDDQRISYPSWYPDGRLIAVTNYANNRVLCVDSTSGHARPLTDPDEILAGMASVSQTSHETLCMAAQRPSGPYDQTHNHIWVQHPQASPVRIQTQGHRNGRAPWWSPCGRMIAFESSDPQTPGRYAIYIYKHSDKSLTPVTPLQDWSCSHPKWHPTIPYRLVIGAVQYENGEKKRHGIAIIDISDTEE